MIRQVKLFLIGFFLSLAGYTQRDSTSINNTTGIFEQLSKSLKEFQLDTTSPPADKLSRKIMELRELRGGFNINEAIEFKIGEDRKEAKVPKAELDKIHEFFMTGNGKRWLDNAVTWIYRRHFTYAEIKKAVNFYRTTAGQKMATVFPVIMMESLRAAEMIKDIYIVQQKNKK